MERSNSLSEPSSWGADLSVFRKRPVLSFLSLNAALSGPIADGKGKFSSSSQPSKERGTELVARAQLPK